MIKRFLACLLTAVMLLMVLVPAPAGAQGEDVLVVIDGKEVRGGIIVEGRTLFPVRLVFEMLGGDVHWDQATQSVSISLRGKTIWMRINDPVSWVNGRPFILDVPPRIYFERTFVPLRFIIEAVGGVAHFVGGVVYITLPPPPPPPPQIIIVSLPPLSPPLPPPAPAPAPVSAPAVSVTLTPSVNSGQAPLTVSLAATVSGGSGDTTFWVDCTGNGRWDVDGLKKSSAAHTTTCVLETAGTYLLKVRAERGGVVAEQTITVVVTAAPAPVAPAPVPASSGVTVHAGVSDVTTFSFRANGSLLFGSRQPGDEGRIVWWHRDTPHNRVATPWETIGGVGTFGTTVNCLGACVLQAEMRNLPLNRQGTSSAVEVR